MAEAIHVSDDLVPATPEHAFESSEVDFEELDVLAAEGHETVSEDSVPDDSASVADAPIPQPASADDAQDDAMSTPHAEEQHTEHPSDATKAKPAAAAAVKHKTTATANAKPSTARPNGTAVRKAASTAGKASAAAAKPTAATKTPLSPTRRTFSASTATKPTAAKPAPSAAAAVNRRASVAPHTATSRAATTATKPAVHFPTAAKPAAAHAGTPRTSAASPAPSATKRPRASVSEGVKRAPLPSRHSLPAVGKPAVKPAHAPLAVKHTRTGTSISSIREVREDGRALEEMQKKLAEALDDAKAKEVALVRLESEVAALKTSLAEAETVAEAKIVSLKAAEEAMQALEKQLKESSDTIESLKAEHEAHQGVQDELDAARAASLAASEQVRKLQSQLDEMAANVIASKEALEALRDEKEALVASHSTDSVAAAAEHEALVKAQAELEALKAELAGSKAAADQRLQEVLSQVADLQTKLEVSAQLEAQLNALKVEKEEMASRLSELEIETLELKEVQESIDDEREAMQTKLKDLESQLAQATKATDDALAKLKAREEDFSSLLANTKEMHAEEMRLSTESYTKLIAQHENIKAELANAWAAHEKGKNDAQTALDEAEKAFNAKQTELDQEIERIQSDLDNQENFYNEKVEAVKAEHTKLLEEAFDRAKKEAAEAHGADLHTLRSNSDATIQQIHAANQVALESLRSEYASTIEDTVQKYEKQISGLNLDLKSAVGDLAKSKASLEVSRADVASLTSQCEVLQAAAQDKSLPVEHLEEVEHYKKELAVARDDLAATNEMLDLTKASLQELSEKHGHELKASAEARAAEVSSLTAKHDDETHKLVSQKSELLIKLSDAESEITTLKATVAEAEQSSVKSNGTPQPPTSPGVTKEELLEMHRAHNLKISDLEAAHEKSIKLLEEQAESGKQEIVGLKEKIRHLKMEVELLTEQVDEGEDVLAQAKADVEQLAKENVQLKAAASV